VNNAVAAKPKRHHRITRWLVTGLGEALLDVRREMLDVHLPSHVRVGAMIIDCC